MATSELRQNMEALAAGLNQLYPGRFDPDEPTPLAVGIREKLASAVAVGERRYVKPMLAWWCKRRKYLQAVLADGAVRHELDGSISGPVTAEQREHAEQVLAKRSKKPKSNADQTATAR